MRFDELSWTKIVTLSIIIVSITKTIFILYTGLNKLLVFQEGKLIIIWKFRGGKSISGWEIPVFPPFNEISAVTSESVRVIYVVFSYNYSSSSKAN